MNIRAHSRFLATLLLWLGLWVAAIGGPLHLAYHAASPDQAAAAWRAADLDAAADPGCSLCCLAHQYSAAGTGRGVAAFTGAPPPDTISAAVTAVLPAADRLHSPRAPPAALPTA